MKTAIIISESRYDIQSAVLRGILDRLSEKGNEAYIFSCHSSLGFVSRPGILFLEDDPLNPQNGSLPAEEPLTSGCQDNNSFMLLNYDEYDAFIIYMDTMPDRVLVNAIAEEIRRTGRPAISMKDNLRDIVRMEIDNTAGITCIIRHLVETLNRKRIFFLAGPEYNEDSIERLTAYRETLSSYGITPESDWIIFGDYHPHSGREAMKCWYEKKDTVPLPDAIVCANDEMAMGVCIQAKEYSIRIPEDIAVSGFDNRVISVLCEPPLTTVAIPGYDLGRACAGRLLRLIDNPSDRSPGLVETEAIFRRSTDSNIIDENYDETIEEIRRHYVDSQIHLSNLLDNLRYLEAGFASARSWDDFYGVIEANIDVFEVKSFYIFTPSREIIPDDRYILSLLRDEEEQTLKRDTEMSAVLAYEEGHLTELEPFSARTLIPDEILKRSGGGYYVINPLSHQNKLFGYCVVCNSSIAYESEWIALLVQIICSAMENLRRKAQLEQMVNTLNHLWVFDKLTGVYNRAGFAERSDNILHQARMAGKDIFVLFADLDRLKYVNDTFGHDAGDSFISETAQILKKVFYKDELITRYGGDEFIVVSFGVDDKEAAKYAAEIDSLTKETDSSGRHPFPVSVSTGYIIGNAADENELESLIEEADKLMYKVKEAKKAIRKD
ncbi:MAG: GGDEF domain-containing protein [Lachnospiraceae bacterium]|nr:GGDEF domain-containing protein [Lachnospiraceae bacterium]